ncbi:MAG: TrkH family potassium uptake protein [Nitrospirales bacterium]|nr:TrkH family potassium uptake protein [Nitrospirales bacterium]
MKDSRPSPSRLGGTIKRLPHELPFQLHVLSPGQIVVLAGAVAILVGTALLLLPWATMPSTQLTLIDAIFTATSAVCVTGLIVADTAEDFTLFGHVVVLILIQIGGLGYAILVTMLLLTIGRQIGLRDRMMMAEALSTLNLEGLVRHAKAIVIWTLTLELIGAVILSVRFVKDYPFGQALYHGIFQAISAFNNAGFSSFSTNLTAYQSDVTVNLVVVLLIIFGGLGFIVLIDVSQMLRRERYRLHTHSKLVLLVTGLLIVGGTTSIVLLEWGNPHTLGDLGWSDKVLVGAFHAISARTAGFNTLDLSHLTNASLYLLVILMFIGGSPGGTAGGIKTTTFGIIGIFVWSTLRHREDVECFWRRAPMVIVHRALSLAILSMVLLTFFTLILNMLESHHFLSMMFEVASALGTTGYSVGNGGVLSLSASFSTFGKLIIIFCMFIGRFGPLLVGLGSFRDRKARLYRFPESKISIC